MITFRLAFPCVTGCQGQHLLTLFLYLQGFIIIVQLHGTHVKRIKSLRIRLLVLLFVGWFATCHCLLLTWDRRENKVSACRIQRVLAHSSFVAC